MSLIQTHKHFKLLTGLMLAGKSYVSASEYEDAKFLNALGLVELRMTPASERWWVITQAGVDALKAAKDRMFVE